MQQRMNANDRTIMLRKAALKVAKSVGYRATTRLLVSIEAGVSPSLVQFYLGDALEMRKNILTDACSEIHLGLILEGIVAGEILAKKVARKHREQIIKYIFGEST